MHAYFNSAIEVAALEEFMCEAALSIAICKTDINMVNIENIRFT